MNLVDGKTMARMLNISDRTLWLWREAGYIPYIPLGKKNIRYIPEEVFKSLKKRQVLSFNHKQRGIYENSNQNTEKKR
jgi:predicted site-specific integrase-resolvase